MPQLRRGWQIFKRYVCIALGLDDYVVNARHGRELFAWRFVAVGELPGCIFLGPSGLGVARVGARRLQVFHMPPFAELPWTQEIQIGMVAAVAVGILKRQCK